MQANSVFFTIEFELLSIVRNEEIYVVFYVPLFGGKYISNWSRTYNLYFFILKIV